MTGLHPNNSNNPGAGGGGGGGTGGGGAASNSKWSGLETSGMREAKCSLLLQDDVPYDAKIKALPKQRVLVYQDRGFSPMVQAGNATANATATAVSPDGNNNKNSSNNNNNNLQDNFYVDFNGATILQLEPGTDVAHKTMPVTVTVGGRCLFTPENYQDFRVMMRTKEQSQEMDVAPNGNFDWPDVSSLLLCPVCGERGPIPRDGDNRDHEYWMAFYPLLQICITNGSQSMTLGTRTICRLVCLECMEDLLEGLSLTVQPGGNSTQLGRNGSTGQHNHKKRSTRLAFTLPAADVLAEAGSASFLEDGPPRPDTHPHVDDILDAWTLYNLWEHSGAWEALQNDYRIVLSRSMNAGGGDPSSSSAQAGTAAAGDEQGGGGGGGGDGAAEDQDDVAGYPSATATAEPRLKERMGRPCGNPQCGKVHGRIEADGTMVRLGIKCRDCHSDFYCSKACREVSHDVHLPVCERKQRDREERREKKAKKVECHTCHNKFPFTRMKKCSRCRTATYCSVECQRADWERHKTICQSMIDGAAAAGGAGAAAHNNNATAASSGSLMTNRR